MINNFHRLKRPWNSEKGSKIVDWLENFTNLSDYEKQRIKDALSGKGEFRCREFPFELYELEKKIPSTFGWRLTIPFLFLVVFLLIITVLPIGYLVNGYWGFERDTIISKFVKGWWKKVGIE